MFFIDQELACDNDKTFCTKTRIVAWQSYWQDLFYMHMYRQFKRINPIWKNRDNTHLWDIQKHANLHTQCVIMTNIFQYQHLFIDCHLSTQTILCNFTLNIPSVTYKLSYAISNCFYAILGAFTPACITLHISSGRRYICFVCNTILYRVSFVYFRHHHLYTHMHCHLDLRASNILISSGMIADTRWIWLSNEVSWRQIGDFVSFLMHHSPSYGIRHLTCLICGKRSIMDQTLST